METLIRSEKKMDDAGQPPTISIPEELVFDILARLPLKSLCICKCVCKTWLSIISDPKFVDLHFTLSKSRPQLLITICSHAFSKSRSFEHRSAGSDEEYRCLFIADEAVDQVNRGRSLALRWQGAIPVKKFSSFESSPGDSQSVNGLIFGLCSQGFIRIANPSAKDAIAFPRAFPEHGMKSDRDSERQVRSVCFRFDPVEGKHKVLKSLSILDSDRAVNKVEHRLATLGEGDDGYMNWRTIEGGSNICSRMEHSICVNGVIYYNACVGNKLCMVAFDVRYEKFRVAKISMEGRFYCSPYPWRYIEFEGKVAVVDYPYSNRDCCYETEDMEHGLELWVLEVFQNQVWSLKYSALPPWPMKMDKPLYPKHKLVGTTLAGKVPITRKTKGHHPVPPQNPDRKCQYPCQIPTSRRRRRNALTPLNGVGSHLLKRAHRDLLIGHNRAVSRGDFLSIVLAAAFLWRRGRGLCWGRRKRRIEQTLCDT